MSAAAEEARPSEAFPWRAVMHAGLFLLRLSPRDFWALTPLEFHALTGGFLPRFDFPLQALMQRFPDLE